MNTRMLLAAVVAAVTSAGCLPQPSAGGEPVPARPTETFPRTAKPAAPAPTSPGNPPAGSPPEVPAGPTAQEIRGLLREELAEVKDKLAGLEPLVRRVNDLTRRTHELDDKLSQVEALREASESDTLRALAAVRTDVDSMKGVVGQLTAAIQDLKTSRPKPADDPTTRADDRLASAVESLAGKVSVLDKKVGDLGRPAAAKSAAKPATWNTRLVTLACGYQVPVSPSTVRVQCPRCGKWFAVK